MKYLFPILLTLTACAPASVEKDVEQLTRSLEDVRSYQADQGMQLGALQDRLRDVQGQLEEMGHKTQSQFGSEVSNLKDDLQALRRRIPPPSIVPATALEQDEAAAARLPEGVSKNFLDGMMRLREGRFSEALSVFTSLTSAPANDEEGALGFFWLGVTYDGLGEFKNSLAAYNTVVTKAASHYRVPLALLRQAGALEKIGDAKATQAVLRKLVAQFPSSPEARIASSRISKS